MRSESQLIETQFIFSVLTIEKRNFLLKLNSTFLKMPVMIRMEWKPCNSVSAPDYVIVSLRLLIINN